MPYNSEHAVRIKSPKQYKKFARKNIALGIDIILGINEDKSETQAYRFNVKNFTIDEVKNWLKKHDIKYTSIEEAKQVQAFSVVVQCVKKLSLSKQDIINQISKSKLQAIKQYDKNPYFSAYIVAHEGEASPKLLGDTTTKPIKWIRKAVQSLKNKLIGVKFYKGHNADNSTTNREELGEVVAEFEKEIDGKLTYIVIGYHPKETIGKVKQLDVCSQEGIWNLIDKGKKFVADSVKKVSAIALGNSKLETPAFAGAEQVSLVQAFNNNITGSYMGISIDELRTVPVNLLKQVVLERDLWPNQLFGDNHDLMKEDRIFRSVYEKVNLLEEENETLKSQLQKHLEEINVFKNEKEKANKELFFKTAKQRLDYKAQIKNLTEHQKLVLSKKFKPDKMENLSDEFLDTFLESFLNEYQEEAIAGIYSNLKEDKIKVDNDKTDSSSIDKDDFTKPENNELLA